jgi:hypothetical protein
MQGCLLSKGEATRRLPWQTGSGNHAELNNYSEVSSLNLWAAHYFQGDYPRQSGWKKARYLPGLGIGVRNRYVATWVWLPMHAVITKLLISGMTVLLR